MAFLYSHFARWSSIGAAVFLAATGAASAAWFSGYEIGVLHDDNLSRAELAGDIESDTALVAKLEGGRAFEFENGRGFTWTGSLGASVHDEFDGMDNFELGLSGTLRKKYGLGPTAPTARLTAAVERRDYDEDVRDGWFYLAEATWGRRTSDRWAVEVGLSYDILRADETNVAGPGPGPGPGPPGPPGPPPTNGPGGPGPEEKPGDTFDQERVSLALAVDYTLNNDWLLTFGYVFRDGDVSSSAIANDRIVDAAEAITDDPVFGPGRFAYRLDAEVHALSIDLDRSVGADASVVFSIELQETSAAGGIDYDKTKVSLSWVGSL